MLLSTRALRRFCTAALLPIVCACAAPSSSTRPKPLEPPPALPVASRPEPPKDPPPSSSPPPVLLRGGTIITAAGPRIENGHVLLEGGKIKAVGAGAGTAQGATVVDATGRFITPGLIDTHSHMGVYPAPGSRGNSDGNEATAPTRPEVWAEHGFWPQDPNLPRAIAGGITTIQVLPGSANLIGGRSFTAKLRLIPGTTTSARQLRFPGAPQGLKMACGENPKRVYGDKGGPETRMGNVARFRQTFQQAREYQRRWQKYERDLAAWRAKQEHKRQNPDAADDDKGKAGPPGPDDPPELPNVDAAMDTLVGVLDGSILVHNHCYRADEMNIMLDVAAEFGFSIRSFHHALEAYKLAPRLAQTKTSVSTWADWWGFKMESYDGIPHNAALVHAAGGIAVIHSDSETEIRHLNQEAAKALAAGRRLGLDLSDDDAVTWVTKNAAWTLGVDDQTGTLEVGKMADVVVWSADPLSVYARADHVYVDGALVYDRKTGIAPVTDFELQNGQTLPQQHTHGAPAGENQDVRR